MKVGDKVVFLKNVGSSGNLTHGKEYVILEIGILGIKLQNDIGMYMWYMRSHFLSFSDFRKYKIKDLLE